MKDRRDERPWTGVAVEYRTNEMLGLGTLRRVARELRLDVAAAHARDPAASGVSSVEILLAWPGVQAILAHRVAHAMHQHGIPVAPRVIAYLARTVTGVE